MEFLNRQGAKYAQEIKNFEVFNFDKNVYIILFAAIQKIKGRSIAVPLLC